jgi:hypothetical protein
MTTNILQGNKMEKEYIYTHENTDLIILINFCDFYYKQGEFDYEWRIVGITYHESNDEVIEIDITNLNQYFRILGISYSKFYNNISKQVESDDSIFDDYILKDRS